MHPDTDVLLAKLSQQQTLLDKQKNDLTFSDDDKTDADKARQDEGASSLSSSLMTPASGSSNEAYSDSDNKDDKLETAEMARIKQELLAAKDQIARQQQELDQSRIINHTVREAVGSSAETEMKAKQNGTGGHQAPVNSPGRTGGSRQDNHWDARSAMSDGTSVNDFGTAQQVWGHANRPAFNPGVPTSVSQQYQSLTPAWGQPGARPWGNRPMNTNIQPIVMPTQQQMLVSRTFSGPASPGANNDYSPFQTGQGLRRSNTQNRATSFYPQARDNTWDMFGGGVGALDGMNIGLNTANTYQAIGMYPAPVPYQPRPIGTPLSPEAAEFRAGQASGNPWNAAVSLLISVHSCRSGLWLLATLFS